MPTVAWILLGALVLAAVLVVALALALKRSHARAVRTEQLVSEARRAVRAVAEEESTTQAEQLRIAIARYEIRMSPTVAIG